MSSRGLFLILSAMCLTSVIIAAETLPDGKPRFVDHGEVVEDRKTSLLWQKDGVQSGARNRPGAIEYAKSLKLGGVGGWRVPTTLELSSIFPADEEPWTNTNYNPRQFNPGSGPFVSYWSADLPKDRDSEYRSGCAFKWWEDGSQDYQHGEKNFHRVRCVRDALQSGEKLIVTKGEAKPSVGKNIRDLIGGPLGERPSPSRQPKRLPDVVPERERIDPSLPVDLRKGLVACWNFDFDDGDRLRDSVGKNHLVRHGGELMPGYRGNAWWRMGLPERNDVKDTLEFCEFGDGEAFNISADSEFTIVGWVLPRAPMGTIFALQNKQTDAQLVLRISQLHPVLVYCEDGTNQKPMSTYAHRVLDYQWRHIAVVRRKDALLLYLEGELVGQSKGAFTGSITTDLRAIGLDREAPRENLTVMRRAELGWSGGLDEFSLYNRPLNESELRVLAAGELAAWIRDTRISPPPEAPLFVLRPQVSTSPRLPPSAQDGPAALVIPPREADTDAKMIDLTKFYNASLKGTWHPENRVSGPRINDLAKLEPGVQQLDGTPFDIRGVIQLQHIHRAYWQGKFSMRVEGIRVKQKFEKIHFLHAAAFSARDGMEIGGYELIYADKTKEWLPIVFGEDVRDWWAARSEPLAGTRSKVVWTGNNDSAAAAGHSLRLFRSTWDNPRPDQEVEKINFISLGRDAAPFLLAITAE